MKKAFLIIMVAIFGACTKKQTSTSNTQIITTIAGNGYRTGTAPSILGGYTGDGGAAIAAELNNPAGVAVDDSGNIYIADYDNGRIRKVSALGTITTFAEISDPNGIAIDGSGNVYVCNGRMYKINSSGVMTTVGSVTDGGGIAVDNVGNVYIARENSRCITKVSATGTSTTIAGNGTEGFSGDGGPATSAELFAPFGVTVDGSGNVYIADWYRIRKVSTSGIISTIAGNGTAGFSGDGGAATAAELNVVSGLTVDGSGNVYILDYNNNRIRKINSAGIISTIAGNGTGGFSGDGGPAISAELDGPDGIAIDGSGNIYVADANNQRIRKVSH